MLESHSARQQQTKVRPFDRRRKKRKYTHTHTHIPNEQTKCDDHEGRAAKVNK